MHSLGKVSVSVKRILNPQTNQNCQSVAPFIDHGALCVRKNSIKSRYNALVISLRKEIYVFLIDTIETCVIRMLTDNHGRIILHAN